MNHIAKHKIDLDLVKLRNEIHDNWTKIEYESALNTSWKKYSLDRCEQVQELNQFYTDLLGCKVTPLCYIQPAGHAILKHIDTSCKASINILLNQTTGAQQPVHFYDEEDNRYVYFYRCALLNVGGYYHEVPVHSTDRIVLRFALQTPFDDAKEKLNQGVMNESSGL